MRFFVSLRMTLDMDIIPGILEKEWGEIEKKLEIAKSFTALNAAAAIHVDILDGKFAPNTTFLDPTPFAKYSKDIFFELHMMVEEPINYLKPYAAVGFKRFLGQIEKMPDQAEFVAQAQALGEVGLAIDGPTDLSAIKVPYGDLDCVLIMTIKAGQSGQEFNPEYLKKIETLRFDFAKAYTSANASADKQVQIGVDGGINDQTILLAKNAGATRFIANSFLFNAQNPQGQYILLKQCLENQ